MVMFLYHIFEEKVLKFKIPKAQTQRGSQDAWRSHVNARYRTVKSQRSIGLTDHGRLAAVRSAAINNTSLRPKINANGPVRC